LYYFENSVLEYQSNLRLLDYSLFASLERLKSFSSP
jgi:hypothetical protein